jgi:hypothetical protein
MNARVRALFVSVLVLSVAAAAVIAVDVYSWRGRRADDMRTFQRATGGVGMGAIATPLWQFINYDARIVSVDDSMTWPVPGGYSYGPDRTGSVSCFQETPEDQWIAR